MPIRVINTEASKRFVLAADTTLSKTVAALQPSRVARFIRITLRRNGEIFDSGHEWEPRGDDFWFSGFNKVFPHTGSVFVELPSAAFEEGDVLTFEFTDVARRLSESEPEDPEERFWHQQR